MEKNDFTRFLKREQLLNYFRQFLVTIRKHWEAIDFIYKEQIWRGFLRYGWVAQILVATGLLISIYFLYTIFRLITAADTSTPFTAINSMGNVIGQFASESYHFLFTGSMKYVLVVLLEIVIFHVSRRTLTILTGIQSDASFNAFLEAQKRMIKVVFRSWILETIVIVLIKIIFVFLGFIDFVKPAAIFIVQCYFLGLAVVDNYHEQFGLSIKESIQEMQRFAGVALAVGMFLQVAFAIPVAGALGGPVIASVAATLAMYDLSDLHRREKQVIQIIDPEEIV